MMTTCDHRLIHRLLPLVLCLLPACQQKMAVQPSYRPYHASAFFPDGQVNRPPVQGTVARGHLRIDKHLFGEPGNRRAGLQAYAVALVGAAGARCWAWSMWRPAALRPRLWEMSIPGSRPFPSRSRSTS